MNHWSNYRTHFIIISDKPSLTTLPSDQIVLEGNTATFHCEATGNPAPKITWMKDGKTVSQEQPLNIETHRNDSGKYWCLAENGLNSTVNASAMLDVQCKRWLFVVFLSMGLKQYAVDVGWKMMFTTSSTPSSYATSMLSVLFRVLGVVQPVNY